MSRNGLKKFLSHLFRIGLSVILLGYLFSKIDAAQIRVSLQGADFHLLAYAGFTFLGIHVFLFARWLILVKALELAVPLSAAIRYFFVGLFFNLFLPTSTGGDVVKVIGLCGYTSQKAKVVASVILDRITGFTGIVLIALIAYTFGHKIINDVSLLIAIFILAGIPLTLLLVLFNERIYSLGCRVFNRWPNIKNKLMELHYDVVLLKGRRLTFLWAVLLSCLCQVILSFTLYLVAQALHEQVSFVYFLIFVPLICVVASLPSIGGLGVRDAGSVYLFGKAGLASAAAISLSLMNFVFMVGVGLIGGIIYAIPHKNSHMESRDALEES